MFPLTCKTSFVSNGILIKHSLAALLIAWVNLVVLASIPLDPDVKECISRILSLNCVFSASVGSLYLLLQSTTPVPLRTTKYYSRTNPYYKVLL